MLTTADLANLEPEELEDLRIYISGPISGHANYNRVAFSTAADFCTDTLKAYHVYNPVEYVGLLKDRTHEEAMAFSLRELGSSNDSDDQAGPNYYNLVVLLNDWDTSEGARLEYQVARSIGISTVLFKTLKKHWRINDDYHKP